MTRWLLSVLCALPLSAQAAVLELPSNAVRTTERTSAADSLRVPTGPFQGAAVPAIRISGAVTRQAWRVEAGGITTAQLIDPLRAQLVDAGFDIAFECKDRACGGFDFRFAVGALPAPDMFVDIGDYRFLSATLDGQAVTILASRTRTSGFVQITRVSPDATDAPLISAGDTPVRQIAPTPVNGQSLAQTLDAQGFAELAGLVFETGSSNLGDTDFAVLQSLADYLLANPSRVVALVGHTDSEGSLDGNIALSKRRAASVLERLVSAYGVPRGQLDAQGMGYLSPVASNLTPEGRAQNRRVEVIITSTN